MTLTILFVGFFGFSFALLYIIHTHDTRRRKGLAALARELGYRFDGERSDLLPSLGRFRLLPAGGNRRITNVLTGETDVGKVSMFDYSWWTGRTRASYNSYTVCTVRSPGLELPYFLLRCQRPGLDRLGSALGRAGVLPQGVGADLGAGDIDFPDDEPFSRRFVLIGREGPVRALFDREVRQRFTPFAGTLTSVEGQGDTLLVAGGIPMLPKTARELLDQAVALTSLLATRKRTGTEVAAGR